MEKQFVPYELSVKLKELGFNEECFASIDSFSKSPYIPSKGGTYKNSTDPVIACPLWQQAFDWFRMEHKLEHWLSSSNDVIYYNIKEVGKVVYWDLELLSRKGYNTHQEARKACLEKLIELVETKKL